MTIGADLNLHLKERPTKNPRARLKVSNGWLYVRSSSQTAERMERSGSLDSALQFGTALGRSKSKLTIPIAAAAFAPRLLPTNCPSGLGSRSLANSTPTRRRWRLEEWNFRIQRLTKLWSIISVSRIPYSIQCHNVEASIQV